MKKNLLYLLLLLCFPFSIFSKNNRLTNVNAVCDDVNNDGICDFSDFIHVDQFGYLENATKVAVISNPQVGFNASQSFTPNNTLEIRDASNDALVYSGNIQSWNSGNTHTQSGDQGWWFDFSTVNAPGEFFVYDPVNEVRSSNFKIGNDVFQEVLKAATKMYYYNRCNATKAAPYAATGWTDGMNFTNPLQDANCRYVYDQSNASLEKDLTGGWFDAGDYNKYVTFTHSVIHNLLWAYEENPMVFGDDWNIPESGNGIPDILDEVKWELEWLLKMTNADGSVHIKMGSINFVDNTAAPPSANSDPRYYGPTCTAASISNASVFAHAARVFQQYTSMNAFATTLETNAENTWNYALPHLNNNTLETACDDGTIKAGDADWDADLQKENAVGAAAHLFALTDDATYNSYFISNINDTEQMNNGYWSGYKLATNDALLMYADLPNADATVASNITNSLSTAASNNWENFFGENDLDLYRSYMPDYSYHWGSNSPKAGFGILNLQLANHNINPSNSSSYESKAAEQIHYFHGVNPMGLVYLSNMYGMGGDRCVNEIYHTWFYDGTDWDNAQTSLYGPAPGFVSGGANKDFTVAALTPPTGQPAQKSYLDFNDGFPNNSWEISEPAIYYQAVYIRLLASQVADASTTPLPVELVYFNASVTNKQQVKLTWKSASEIDNDFFEIQRSADGQNFERIAQVAGNGTTSIGQTYTAMDSTPLKGLSYYRIKQVDTDGRSEIFPVKSVFVASSEVGISLQPNPAKDQVLILLEASEKDHAQISVLTVDGKTVLPQQFFPLPKGENQMWLKLDGIVEGIYLVKIIFENGEISMKRFVVGE